MPDDGRLAPVDDLARYYERVAHLDRVVRILRLDLCVHAVAVVDDGVAGVRRRRIAFVAAQRQEEHGDAD